MTDELCLNMTEKKVVTQSLSSSALRSSDKSLFAAISLSFSASASRKPFKASKGMNCFARFSRELCLNMTEKKVVTQSLSLMIGYSNVLKLKPE